VALQVSARRPRQQWPAAQVIDTAHRLCRALDVHLLLLWSPGDVDVPTHPGSDRDASVIAAACTDIPLVPCPTRTLPELVAALSLAQIVVSPDGGAMHIAAALRRPVVGLFGDSDPARWHPWCATYRVLSDSAGHVAHIDPDRIVDAVAALLPDAPSHACSHRAASEPSACKADDISASLDSLLFRLQGSEEGGD
jgi:ADP-heptose:LPS heptosyltransferase